MAKFANGMEKITKKDFIIRKRLSGADRHVEYFIVAAGSNHIMKMGLRRKADADKYVSKLVRKMNNFLKNLDPILIEDLNRRVNACLEYKRSQVN